MMLIKCSVTEHLLAKQGLFLSKLFLAGGIKQMQEEKKIPVLAYTGLIVALTLLRNNFSCWRWLCWLLFCIFSQEESGWKNSKKQNPELPIQLCYRW